MPATHPRISLHITHSPLLPSIAQSSTTQSNIAITDSPSDILSALLTQRGLDAFGHHAVRRDGLYSPHETGQIGSSSFSHHQAPDNSCGSLASLISPLRISSASYHPKSCDQQFPSLPAPSITPQSIIFLLDLLDESDKDVAIQVASAEENIKDTRELIYALKAERHEMRRQARRKSVKQELETKHIDDDFWLNA